LASLVFDAGVGAARPLGMPVRGGTDGFDHRGRGAKQINLVFA
jgi:hypothetical protein